MCTERDHGDGSASFDWTQVEAEATRCPVQWPAHPVVDVPLGDSAAIRSMALWAQVKAVARSFLGRNIKESRSPESE